MVSNPIGTRVPFVVADTKPEGSLTPQMPHLPRQESPVRPHILRNLLAGYDQHIAHILVQGFIHGFSLYFQGPNVSYTASNSLSALQHPEEVDAKLQKELSMGHVAGPYDKPPYKTFRCSPISIRHAKLIKFFIDYLGNFPST